ncbi:MAG: RNA ligase family protein [Planctomycetia bacterium]|nr:RNA ligase family protein [Planctomycetia bacterium]
MSYDLIKYPRTPHLEGSRLQEGDEDLAQVRFSEIAGKFIVVEEKCDGANSAISFDSNGELKLQSRGHFLTGGGREKHFNFLKQWAEVHRNDFYEVLGSRYIMYGEWMYAKHSIFYNALPHYFLEFDILDRETGRFLDTASRHEMLALLPVVSVPVLYRGSFSKLSDLTALVGHSKYIRDDFRENLRAYAEGAGLNVEQVLAETHEEPTMEGLYLKVEDGGEVVGRLKYVRVSFLQTVLASGTHWLQRPIVPNQLARPMDDLFLPTLPEIPEGV